MLRSPEWIADCGAHVGGTVWLNMPEMGVEGEAEVLDIGPAQVYDVRPGLVTGTFRHTSGEVYDLKLASESKPIGVTGTHPFWSVSREAWVSVLDLEIGETLKTLEGTTVVESRARRPSPEAVYNIEVEGDHCYRVGESGVLVHNASCPEDIPEECRYFKEDFSQEKDGTATPVNGKLYLQLEQNPTKGARAKGVKARLCKANITGGTPANVDISGWADAKTILGGKRKGIVDRAHLLANKLGGSGDLARNLVVACSDVNKDMWSQFEEKVYTWIQNSPVQVVVDYSANVTYSGDGVYAKSITVSAIGWDPEESCKQGKIVCKEFGSKTFDSEPDIRYCKGGPYNL